MNSLQKIIQNQSGVSQSLYMCNITSINNTINNNNEGVKYDSYQRYLLKKKGVVFSKQESLNISSEINKNCNFCINK